MSWARRRVNSLAPAASRSTAPHGYSRTRRGAPLTCLTTVLPQTTNGAWAWVPPRKTRCLGPGAEAEGQTMAYRGGGGGGVVVIVRGHVRKLVRLDARRGEVAADNGLQQPWLSPGNSSLQPNGGGGEPRPTLKAAASAAVSVSPLAMQGMTLTLSCSRRSISRSRAFTPWPLGARKYRHTCTRLSADPGEGGEQRRVGAHATPRGPLHSTTAHGGGHLGSLSG